MIFALSVALASPSWRLAGIYDATAISTLEDSSSSYSYRPRRGMVESCGPAKSPDGMGVFEAEAAGSKLMPVLAIVLTGGDTPLTTENVRVSLGRGLSVTVNATEIASFGHVPDHHRLFVL